MLKWIALVLMLVDHFAYVMVDSIPHELYLPMRILGRLSFPVFVYYVVLGLGRTSSLKVYMGRLLLFALFSEIVIRYVGLFSHPYLNVIFSLLLYGLIYIIFENKLSFEIDKITRSVMIVLLIILLPYVEYGFSGFLVFASLYYINKKVQDKRKFIYAAILISLSFVPEMVFNMTSEIQLFAGISGLLMFNRNLDKRMFAPAFEKWTFYWVYPLQWIFFGVIYYYL